MPDAGARLACPGEDKLHDTPSRVKMRTSVLLLLSLSPVAAFIPVPAGSIRLPHRGAPINIRWTLAAAADDSPSSLAKKKTSPDEVVKVAKDYAAKAADALKDIDSDSAGTSIAEWAGAVSANVWTTFSPDVKGEWWAVAPPVLLLGVVYGHIPIIGPILDVLSGPGMIFLGLGFIVAAFAELGENLSPWPQPTPDNELKTDGIYSIVRHPIYSGILLLALGLAVATSELERLLLTGLLFLALEKKTEYEEKYLAEKHPAYKTYKEETAKYFPFIY